jgi:hypothetical protein
VLDVLDGHLYYLGAPDSMPEEAGDLFFIISQLATWQEHHNPANAVPAEPQVGDLVLAVTEESLAQHVTFDTKVGNCMPSADVIPP